MPPQSTTLPTAPIPLLRRDPRSDAELLARFLDDRDQTAFEALLVRHAPAVRAACRGWLRSEADLDDAAQATFLVLVRRAASIRDRAALGSWLYRVAVNVARRLRARRQTDPLPTDLAAPTLAADEELREVLAKEVARLPEKYRLPVQLCYLGGLTTVEAAGLLGWAKGTVLSRLAWARERLRKNLARRGIAPAALAALVGTASSSVCRNWVGMTARAAQAILTGESPGGAGASAQAILLTEGVVRAMRWNKLYVALAALLAAGLVGFGISQWSSAADPPGGRKKPEEDTTRIAAQAPAKEAAKADESKPPVPGRRREAVIRLPVGTFVKEVDVAPYGSGRLTWTYEEDRVLGQIEGSVMGVEFELATEAEFSLSSSGTIYGLVTSVRLNHLRLPEQFAELKPFAGLWPAIEPLVNEVLLDLPFSYQFRIQGDRLIITNYRILLAGPNPLGKVGGMLATNGGEEMFGILAYFQAVGTAIEGTYLSADAKEKPVPIDRPRFRGPRGASVRPSTVPQNSGRGSQPIPQSSN
jgi:RNA polymerase sigma factor (sigma-70 family)